MGGSITQGWGRSRGRCRGLSFFLKNAFLGLIRIGLVLGLGLGLVLWLGLGLVLWLGLGLVSTITLTLTLKQRSFIKKDTPRFRSRSRPRVLLTPVPAGGQGSNPGSLNYGGG